MTMAEERMMLFCPWLGVGVCVWMCVCVGGCVCGCVPGHVRVAVSVRPSVCLCHRSSKQAGAERDREGYMVTGAYRM